MFPFFTAVSTVFKLKRKCPNCRREQVVKPSQKNQTVSCKFCSARIPPPRR